MVREDEVIGKIEKIPEGSQFEKYLKILEPILSGEINEEKMDQFEQLLKQVFHDCVEVVSSSKSFGYAIKIFFIYNNDQYIKLEQESSKKAINIEVAKGPSTAFVLHRGLESIIYLNVARLLCAKNKPSLMLMLTGSLIHEILHLAHPEKSEQEIFDLEVEHVEKFLGVELPREFKELKASDYYENTKDKKA